MVRGGSAGTVYLTESLCEYDICGDCHSRKPRLGLNTAVRCRPGARDVLQEERGNGMTRENRARGHDCGPLADDLVAGFQHWAKAEMFLRDLQERLAKFGLEIHPNSCMMLADAIRMSHLKTSSQNNSLPAIAHG